MRCCVDLGLWVLLSKLSEHCTLSVFLRVCQAMLGMFWIHLWIYSLAQSTIHSDIMLFNLMIIVFKKSTFSSLWKKPLKIEKGLQSISRQNQLVSIASPPTLNALHFKSMICLRKEWFVYFSTTSRSAEWRGILLHTFNFISRQIDLFEFQ